MIKTIAIVTIMLLIIALMLLSIRRTWMRVDYTLRRLFMQKVSFGETGEAYAEPEKSAKNIKQEYAQDSAHRSVIPTSADNLRIESYKNNSLRQDYKAIKKISGYTPDYALNCAKEQIDKTEGYVKQPDYAAVFHMLNLETVYELSALEEDKQEELLRSCIPESSKSILDEYLAEKNGRMDSVDFYSYLKQMSEIYNSGFTVKTGNIEDDGRILADGSRMIYDDQICEGSQVVYANRLYDYSI